MFQYKINTEGNFKLKDNHIIRTSRVDKVIKQVQKTQPNAPNSFQQAEAKVIKWMANNGLLLLRVSLGVIYFWFGVLKFFPGLSPAEILAAKTIYKLSFGLITADVSLPILAVWECALGVGLVVSKGMKMVLLLLFLQMSGTFLPLAFFPDETWAKLLVPTLEGQYIIKNIVIVSAGIVLGATIGGGGLSAHKEVSEKLIKI